ncbi:MAG: WYL domain-containing protein [Bacteroides sp.]
MVTDKSIWLAELLYRKKYLKLDEIQKKWIESSLSDGKELHRRTIQETFKKIEKLFDVNVVCNHHTNEYYYEDLEAFQKNSLGIWLLKTLSVTNALQDCQHLRNKILLEEPAKGLEYLPSIIEAINSSMKLEIDYHSFKGTSYTTVFSTYCIKNFKRRWYILGFSERHGERRIFALDRILNINMTSISYVVPVDFDSEIYFKSCYGVTYSPELKLETIVFKAIPDQRPYFRTCPIHPSQIELSEGVFQIKVFVSFDLIEELLTYGASIEIIEPLSLRDRMRQRIEEMHEMYKKR